MRAITSIRLLRVGNFDSQDLMQFPVEERPGGAARCTSHAPGAKPPSRNDPTNGLCEGNGGEQRGECCRPF